MKKAGVNLLDIKEVNRTLLLQLICTAGQTTRSELSRKTNLSSMTVTNIVNEFLAKNLIEESIPAEHAKTPGRTPMTLGISPSSPVTLGIFVTRTCLYGTVGDLSLQLLDRKTLSLETDETEATILSKLRRLTQSLLEPVSRPVLGLGIATAGVIDRDGGSIRYITDFYGIQTLDIREYLSHFFSFPIYVCNDMQAGALAELYFGWGKTEDSFLYVGVTHGLGAALAARHDLLDCCGEIGHMSVNTGGPQCACGGKGCLELYASTPNILRKIREETGLTVATMEAAAALARDNVSVHVVLYNALRQLTYGINNYLNLMNVSTVVLGHDAYHFPADLVANMEQTLAKINVSMRQSGVAPKFVGSAFGANAPLYGAVCVVLRQLFQGNYPIDALPDPQS